MLIRSVAQDMQDVETNMKMVCPPIHPCNIPLLPGLLPVLTQRSLLVSNVAQCSVLTALTQKSLLAVCV